MLEAIEELNLVSLNDGSPTLFSAPGGSQSAVDLTVCSPTLAPHFDWSTTDETLGSNHIVILIKASIPGFNAGSGRTSKSSPK